MKRCPKCGRPMPSKPRSTGPLSQNTALHGLYDDIAKHLGYEKTDIERYCKHRFGPWKSGHIAVAKSETEWTMSEAAEHIETVIRWASQGCPNEDGEPMVDGGVPVRLGAER